MTEFNLKVFGERNTATRAVKQMLRSVKRINMNVGAHSEELSNVEWAGLTAGINLHYTHEWRKVYLDALRDVNCRNVDPLCLWKHAAPLWSQRYVEEQVHTLFTVRNPYSWALSMAVKPYHMKANRTSDFDVFISRPWLTEQRENAPIVLPSVLSLWNKKVESYELFSVRAKMHNLSSSFVLFEDFVANPVSLLTKTLGEMGLTKANLKALQESTKRNGKPLKEIQDYYKSEGWRMRLTRQSVDRINQEIDWQLATRHGFEKLDPSDFPKELSEEDRVQFAYEMMNMDRTPDIVLQKQSLKKVG